MTVKILTGDCRDVMAGLDAESIDCVVTSPPYWGLRDFRISEDEFGLETTIDLYVQHSVEIFRQVRRVLKKRGTLWLNLGDCYITPPPGNKDTSMPKSGLPNKSENHRKRAAQHNRHKDDGVYRRMLNRQVGHGEDRGAIYNMKKTSGLKTGDLVGMPWRVALALQADGWYLRNDIVWHKNPMPESCRDRCTKAHEYIFLLTKSRSYHYDAVAIQEQTDKGPANKRTVWKVAVEKIKEQHFAIFPTRLIEPCIKAGCPIDGWVLDPFGGSGTTGLVSEALGRNCILIDANPEHSEMARNRIMRSDALFADVEVV